MLLLKNRSFRQMALALVLLVFSTSLMAADITIKANNEPLKSVLEKITQQSGYEFAYANAIDPNLKVSVEATNQDSDVFFKEFFNKYGIAYKITGKTVSLSKMEQPAKQQQAQPSGKNVKISGVVLDENGASLPGVYVMVMGTKRGTTTDITGKYELDCTVGEKLQYSCMGFKNVEMTVGKSLNPFRNVVMAEDLVALEEAVVIGYGSTQKIKDITGSISHVGAKVIEQQSMGNSIASVLQGKAAGVNVMIESASPTSPVSVSIRGMSSLGGNNQPLWVVDGVPQYNDGIDGSDVNNVLYSLNLNDVESIDILKDASSTAIYGSRAANGVVVVTTKSSKDGMKPTLEFSSRIGVQVPDFNSFEYFNAAQYREFIDAAMRRDAYLSPYSSPMSAAVMQFLDRSKLYALNTSEYSVEDFVALPNAFYDADTDWIDLMLQNPVQQYYDLTLRGGVKNLNYLVSMSYNGNEGVVKSGYNRMFSGRIRLEATINKHLKMRVNASGSTRNAQNKDAIINDIKTMRPDVAPFNEDGTPTSVSYANINPYSRLADVQSSTGENLSAGAELELTFLKDFKFTTNFNISYSNNESLQFVTSRSMIDGSGQDPYRYWARPKSDTKMWTNTLMYNKTIGKHNIHASLSASMERYQTATHSMYALGFPDEEKLNSFTNASSYYSMGETYLARSLASQIGRVQYNYGDRYLATVTLRRDGSSRFGEGKRWGWFPSFGLGWTITNEEFFKNWNIDKIVSFVKFRASYGRAGSQNLADYQWMTQVNSNEYNDEPGLAIKSLGNPTLRWEETVMTDLAMDMEFWNSRIRASVGWFKKDADDLIYSQNLPYSSSFTTMNANVASTTTKGYEFSFDIDVVKNSKWQLTLNLNGAHQDTWVDSFNNELVKIQGSYDLLEAGEKINRWYGYKTYGRLFATAEEVAALRTRYGAATPTAAAYSKAYRTTYEDAGDIYFVDVNGDGVVNTNDKTVLGSWNPKLYGGFGLQLYIGTAFNIGASFSYSYGNLRYWASGSDDVNNLTNRNHSSKTAGMSAVLGKNSPYDITTMPNIGSLSANGGFANPNDYWLYDGSYIRLSGINARYRLGKQYFRNTIIDNIELSLSASNLFTLTRYPGFDPQGNFNSYSTNIRSNLGIDYSTYPSSKTFIAGVKITFR